ncbi:hypothetical protein SAMN05660841_02644 [Sphingobacterium nematocida]|uniref:Uncharacterized protein n=1 Tax=Sphingobacterium nematocida TaxID=1513896 RepID=A0A1T5EJQ9_9SPHI|nr:transcriptional regulator [Sphingobacterium nematocida]SKB84282.1 hypothetical protein SAMN05660841_02644 [Sphingobacterium nematocida]
MKTHFDIEKLVESGKLNSELDYERAMIADRKLRLMAKENPHLKKLRSKLRQLIVDFENSEWNDVDVISTDQLLESEKAGKIAEFERQFIANRKDIIRKKLKSLDLTQENLGVILGHKSKTHMSELMNGIKPFTLRDLVIIGRLLKIEMNSLIPVFLSSDDAIKVKTAVESLHKPQVKLSSEDLVMC